MGGISLTLEKSLKDKILYLSKKEYEIGGWLIGEKVEDGLLFKDLIIPPQEVSGGQVELDSDSMVWLLKNHKKDINNIVGHWHSHNSMGAFFSGGDEENHKKLINGRKLFGFIVSSFRQNALEFKGRILIKDPFALEVDCEVCLEEDEQEERNEALEKEITEKVKVKKYDFSGFEGGSSNRDYSGFYDGYGYGSSVGDYESNFSYDGQTNLYARNLNQDKGNGEWNIKLQDLTENELKIIKETIDYHRKSGFNVDLKITAEESLTSNCKLTDVTIECRKKKMKERILKELDAYVNLDLKMEK